MSIRPQLADIVCLDITTGLCIYGGHRPLTWLLLQSSFWKNLPSNAYTI